MGAAERATRQSVLERAGEAVERTNEVINRYNECMAAVQSLGTDLVLETRDRKDALIAVNARLNLQAKAQADAEKFTASVDRRCDRLESNLSGVAGRVNDLFERSFFGRLKFVVLGR